MFRRTLKICYSVSLTQFTFYISIGVERLLRDCVFGIISCIAMHYQTGVTKTRNGKQNGTEHGKSYLMS